MDASSMGSPAECRRSALWPMLANLEQSFHYGRLHRYLRFCQDVRSSHVDLYGFRLLVRIRFASGSQRVRIWFGVDDDVHVHVHVHVHGHVHEPMPGHVHEPMHVQEHGHVRVYVRFAANKARKARKARAARKAREARKAGTAREAAVVRTRVATSSNCCKILDQQVQDSNFRFKIQVQESNFRLSFFELLQLLRSFARSSNCRKIFELLHPLRTLARSSKYCKIFERLQDLRSFARASNFFSFIPIDTAILK